jgi:hypothetical protein
MGISPNNSLSKTRMMPFSATPAFASLANCGVALPSGLAKARVAYQYRMLVIQPATRLHELSKADPTVMAGSDPALIIQPCEYQTFNMLI